jgi:hypothetical protein
MYVKSLISVFFVVFITLMTSCATLDTARHQYIMRGQVLDATDDMVYLCIGSNDGAEVGQEFNANRFTRISSPNPKSPSLPHFSKEVTGTVIITEIVDEHFARARILTGSVQVNDVVELNK